MQADAGHCCDGCGERTSTPARGGCSGNVKDEAEDESWSAMSGGHLDERYHRHTPQQIHQLEA